jgi:hypothetical protein
MRKETAICTECYMRTIQLIFSIDKMKYRRKGKNQKRLDHSFGCEKHTTGERETDRQRNAITTREREREKEREADKEQKSCHLPVFNLHASFVDVKVYCAVLDHLFRFCLFVIAVVHRIRSIEDVLQSMNKPSSQSIYITAMTDDEIELLNKLEEANR